MVFVTLQIPGIDTYNPNTNLRKSSGIYQAGVVSSQSLIKTRFDMTSPATRLNHMFRSSWVTSPEWSNKESFSDEFATGRSSGMSVVELIAVVSEKLIPGFSDVGKPAH